MKKIICSTILLLCISNAFAQVPFWTEDFGTACSSGQSADGFVSVNGTWSVTATGPNDIYPNEWYVSAEEGGEGAGNCGAAECGGTDNRTLHLGYSSLTLGDYGSAYASFNGIYDTDTRVESPVISCAGKNSITVSFAYFLEGITGADYMEVQYSANGGGTWSLISSPPITANCLPQGFWTTFSLSLPASANNNPNVKIGFRWVNTDPSGGTLSTAVDDMTITGVPIFTPTFAIVSPICVGNSQTITASTGSFVVSGYTWTAAPAGPVIASPNASTTGISFPGAGNFVITLNAISGTTSATYTQGVVVNINPTITTVANPTMICPGATVAVSVSGANSYTWNPGALIGGTIVVNPTVTSTYSVIAASVAGCTVLGTKSVSVATVPNLTLTGSPGTICPGQSAILNGSGFNTYTWTPGNANGFSLSVSPTVTTIYTVNATSAQSCASGPKNLTITVVPCTGISANQINANPYTVYPNPVSDNLFIRAEGIGAARVEVFDATGKSVLKEEHNFNETDNTHSVNVNGINPGIYLVKISSLAGSKVIRFIKE